MAVARAILFDLLMGVMDSLQVWTVAAGERERGLQWRDAVTARMAAAGRYAPYEELLVDGAAEVGLPPAAVAQLLDGWQRMEPWPDAVAVGRLSVPYAFVTNCSADLARVAADRARLSPEFTLSAEEAGWYKPAEEMYRAALLRMGLKPAETVFVAGSPYDAVGARAAGLRAAFVRRRPDQLTPYGVMTLESLTEVVSTLVD
jgi:2-haloalkanoic acid dehalogenase type II